MDGLLLNNPHVNEIILRGQNISLRSYQPLELLTYIHKLKGDRSFQIGNLSMSFEHDSDQVRVEPGPTGSTKAYARRQNFFETSNFDS